MCLIISGTFAAGLITTSVMHTLAVESMMIRYPVAVLAAYGAFFVLIKLWLLYVLKGNPDGITDRDIMPSPTFGGISDISGASGITGGGGQFGGAGASGDFAPDVAQMSATVGGESAIGDVSDAAGDALSDDGAIVLLVIVAAVTLVAGAGIYLVWQAPAIMTEAAFDAMLAGGLIRRAKRVTAEDWQGDVFRATWPPFALVMVLSITVGGVIHFYFPEASTLREAIKMALGGA